MKRALLLIALLTGVGIAKVAQQTVLTVSAYRLGRTYTEVHQLENDTLWLQTKVMALESPIKLAETIRKQRVELVAWSHLAQPATAQLAQATTDSPSPAIKDPADFH